jgi:hypothetical protein
MTSGTDPMVTSFHATQRVVRAIRHQEDQCHEQVQSLILTTVEFRLYALKAFPDIETRRQLMPKLVETKKDTAVAPIMLTPRVVEAMIAQRQAVQVVKFRTTCTDCLPNY